ncbi:MerR family transcriptional regulator [Streptomyces chumphonensis]|uniref:MerR family transcriptional regulator n=1 Tax=Streptomyces chumphonensis TaxID=1214925 RepID=A0A927EYL7_9ACTN|nr:MerR family transcriptional regulator [Streptomyces chumphonensis]MBD3931132.1 MerR family transcriptional regulator [Streptomyces chumphonensis]
MRPDPPPLRPAVPRPAETPPVLLPVGAAAKRLRTNAATLRAWERRYGLGPSGRSSGGHRRYSPDDLQRLRRMLDLLRQGVAAADAARVVRTAPAADPTPPDVAVGDLLTAMRALDAPALTRLAGAALRRHGAAGAWTAVFAPALVAVGDHWDATGCGVETEHLASGILEAALRGHLAVLAAEGRRPPVLLATAPGEHHTLPMTALAAALAERGQSSVLTGYLPGRALADAVATVRPHAVVLWARRAATADVALLARTARAGPAPVHPAGPGWPTPPADAACAPLLANLPDAVRALTVRAPAPRSGPA